MYQIGQTAKITKTSARMLRYYDTKKILSPSLIAPNGYRLYSNSDIEIIMKIKHLRHYHFSYQEITDILTTYTDIPKEIYLEKLKELKNTAADYDLLIAELKNTYNVRPSSKICNDYAIAIVHKSGFHAICRKATVTELTLEAFITTTFTQISRQKYMLLGKFFIIFHTYPSTSQSLFEVEYCQPIQGETCPQDFELKYFKDSFYLSTIHYGDYSTLHLAYSQLYAWADQHHYTLKEPFMESYFIDSYWSPQSQDFITEISIALSNSHLTLSLC